MTDELYFVAVGDSTMWGMGLDPEDKYVSRFYAYLTTGDTLNEERDLKAQVGAVIDYNPNPAICDVDKDYDYSIAEKYGRTDTERFGRKGVSVAHPSILEQIENLPYDFDIDDQFREDNTFKATYPDESAVDVVLLTGSINDLGSTMPFSVNAFSNKQDEIDNNAGCFSYEGLKQAIFDANNKFPNATIYVCGYFPPSSRESFIPELAQNYMDKAAFILGGLGGLSGIVVGGIGLIGSRYFRRVFTNTNHRYEYFYKKKAYEMRKAVYEADKTIDSPVLFALPGFKRGNVPHASSAWPIFPYVPPRSYREQLLYGLPILEGNFEYNPGDQSQERIDARYEVVDKYDEVSSFSKNSSMHPNADGAERYLDVLTDIDHQNFSDGWSLREVTQNLSDDDQDADNGLDVLAAFERYGLNPEDGLRSCCNMTKVDSMEVVIETGSSSIASRYNEVNFDVYLRNSFAKRRAGEHLVSSGYEIPPPPADESMITQQWQNYLESYFDQVDADEQYVARFNLNQHRDHPAYGSIRSDGRTHSENRIRGASDTRENLALDPIFDDMEIIERTYGSNDIPFPPFSSYYNAVFEAAEPLYLWDIDGFRILRLPSSSTLSGSWDVETVEIYVNGMEAYRYDSSVNLEVDEDFVVLDLPNYPNKDGANDAVIHVEWSE